jgi:hypothetical protein
MTRKEGEREKEREREREREREKERIEREIRSCDRVLLFHHVSYVSVSWWWFGDRSMSAEEGRKEGRKEGTIEVFA